MIVFKLLIAAIVIVIGLRLIGAAFYTFFTGKMLVRRGRKTRWVSAPADTDFLTLLIRDGLMGALLVVLGVVLIV
ncbi:MAG: hypothetical protein JW953_15120 [Anaerolineae bacterium]|nr:hypothetical protein [Anaerolineae bacterium]